jgi:putative peptide zinc metalloprotease protein
VVTNIVLIEDSKFFVSFKWKINMNEYIPLVGEKDIALYWRESSDKQRSALLEIDRVFFTLSEHLGLLVEQLLKRPLSTTAELISAFEIATGRRISIEELQNAKAMLPSDLFQQETAKRDSSIKFQKKILGEAMLDPVIAKLKWMYAPKNALILFSFSCAMLGIIFYFFALYDTVTGKLTSTDSFIAFVLFLMGVLFHELGHVTACVKYGIPQGGIGFGFYWGFPVFYADVRATWRLNPQKRAIVAAGGIYFQSVFLAVLLLAYSVTNSATYAAASLATIYNILSTLNPILKYDGYWILSDLLGLENLHTRLRHAFVWAFRGDSALGDQPKPGRIELVGCTAFIMLVAVCVVPILWSLEIFSLALISKWKGWFNSVSQLSEIPMATFRDGAVLLLCSALIALCFISLLMPLLTLARELFARQPAKVIL